MVYSWNCQHCSFNAWGAKEPAIAQRVKSHVASHHRDCLTKDNFQLKWNCPYCDRTAHTHEQDEGVQEFKDHLYAHVDSLLEKGVHVTDRIGGTADILVLSPVESPGADNARIHFIGPCDIAICVTTNPASRIRLFAQHLDELPAKTIVITTVDDPLDGFTDVDVSNGSLEIVRLDGGLGLSGLGETLSRVVSEQESVGGKISFEFDIVAELTNTFDLQEVFQFFHLVSSRLEEADALSHYYLDPQTVSDSTINILNELFDLTIEVEGGVFVAPE